MKDHSIVLNVMSGNPGEVLERSRGHLVRREEDGRVVAVFSNPAQEEQAVKLTLTALSPYTEFQILTDQTAAGKKRANAAGILECRFVIPAGSILTVREAEP